MKLSYNWIKDYVDLEGISPEEMARGLTMSGSEVDCIEDAGEDKVMDMEITSNRPDCLNMTGLAREVSAIFGKTLRLPETALDEKAIDRSSGKVECVIEAGDLCPLYTARVVSGVSVKPAGDNIKDRISAVGLRPVNNVVDVTNFCLMETGQPLHAFDLDKIKGGKILIRKAKKGEKILTIDDVERELKSEMLVIADAAGPIAVAGVMGGKATEVTEDTENILLESAYFDPVSIRRTARSLGLSSDSSYRFERGVDKTGIITASDRAAGLIMGEAGGKPGEMALSGKLTAEKTGISFDVDKACKLLGVKINKGEVRKILEKLGVEVAGEQEGVISVNTPSFREDLKNSIDLVEEVARIYGYDNIPVTVARFVPAIQRKGLPRRVLEMLRKSLPAMGLSEIMTYSLVNDEAVERFKGIVSDPVGLSNPLSEEHKVLTPHLMDGMMKAISHNINRQNADLGFFEIGKIYSKVPGERPFAEEEVLCIGITGDVECTWQAGGRPADIYYLKGLLENAFKPLKVTVELLPVQAKGFISPAEVRIKGQQEGIGIVAGMSPGTLKGYNIQQPVFAAQVRLGEVIKKALLEKHYHSLPKFPFSSRDISVLCDSSVLAGDILSKIESSGEDLIKAIKLVDVYQGEQIPEGKKSLTYSITYGLDIRTLREEEIESVHAKIKETLEKGLGVAFR